MVLTQLSSLTNTYSIGSDCHWFFISGHEEIASDYRQNYPSGTK